MKFKFFILLFVVIIGTGCIKESPKETPEQRVPSYEETQNFFTPREIITKNEIRKYVSTVWGKIKDTKETKFVTSEKYYSAIIFIQPYTIGIYDNSTTEWVVIISSIPEREKYIKIAIFRLDYETYGLKKAYNFNYTVSKEFTLEESVAIMKEEKNKTDLWNKTLWSVNDENVISIGENYFYMRPKEEYGEFGGTIIANKYAGKVIYFAGTIWSGRGWLIIPEKI